MTKCTRCGAEFSGDICPECGGAVTAADKKAATPPRGRGQVINL